MSSTKHLFSIGTTVLLFGLVQEQYYGLAHLAVGSMVIYVLIRCMKGAYMPQTVFLVAMLHLSFSHIRRQLHERSSRRVELDYTGAQMVFVIKVTSLAFCIHDGRRCLSRSAFSALFPYQRKNAIAQVPDLLEYLGYIFFFPGFAVGPAFEMATYRQMVSLDTKHVRRQLAVRAYRRLAESIFWMIVYVVYSDTFTFANLAMRQFYARRSFISAALYLCITGVVVRAAYYTAWKMSEGACILTGLGFDGYDEHGNPRWMDIANIHVRDVELGSSIKQLIDNWNIGTNTWLRNHVYLRIISPSATGARVSSTKANILTFLVSAWWHGFYPGYYLTFVLGALAASSARTLRRNLHPLVAHSSNSKPSRANAFRTIIKAVYDVCGWLMSKYTLDFVVAPFMILSLHPALLMWKLNYCAVPLGILVIFILFNLLGAGRYLRRVAGLPQPQQLGSPFGDKKGIPQRLTGAPRNSSDMDKDKYIYQRDA
ncbi:MBOAT-domain-containing protein [Coemansia reversa NRRL 1564]|uniref:MBOAT-domain-containing protein n=1 Tax=Coemansia reversa (strain ATCC 12441 / NRRL 1564) TaxID=763665 RepID=A0A2G5B9W3_COERN|nr:MBOAT-domain-containing protein [Coemansia reversa NRRL 1564]|eukprot:PIA15801.1 MBOAT-domain-containing protein [Coemansia reversa NRRL 1564]